MRDGLTESHENRRTARPSSDIDLVHHGGSPIANTCMPDVDVHGVVVAASVSKPAVHLPKVDHFATFGFVVMLQRRDEILGPDEVSAQ